MPARLTALQERILLELSGRGQHVRLRDLCDTIEADPRACKRAITDLWFDDMVKHQYGFDDGRENPAYSITWIGEEWLANRPRPSVEPQPKRRWFQRARAQAKK